MKILIVDDEPEILDCLTDYLEMIGHRIVTANSGLNAVKQLSQQPDIEVVFSDIRMPKMDGIRLKQKIGETLPFIFMSGHLDDEKELQQLGVNYTGFLLKPFKLAELRSYLN